MYKIVFKFNLQNLHLTFHQIHVMNHLYLYSLFMSVLREPLASVLRPIQKKIAKISSVCISSLTIIINNHQDDHFFFSQFKFSTISLTSQRDHLTPSFRKRFFLFLFLSLQIDHDQVSSHTVRFWFMFSDGYLEHVTLEAGIYGRPNRVLWTAARHFLLLVVPNHTKLVESLKFVVFCNFFYISLTLGV